MCRGKATNAAGASFRGSQGRGAAFGIKPEGVTKCNWRGRAGWRGAGQSWNISVGRAASNRSVI